MTWVDLLFAPNRSRIACQNRLGMLAYRTHLANTAQNQLQSREKPSGEGKRNRLHGARMPISSALPESLP